MNISSSHIFTDSSEILFIHLTIHLKKKKKVFPVKAEIF